MALVFGNNRWIWSHSSILLNWKNLINETATKQRNDEQIRVILWALIGQYKTLDWITTTGYWILKFFFIWPTSSYLIHIYVIKIIVFFLLHLVLLFILILFNLLPFIQHKIQYLCSKNNCFLFTTPCIIIYFNFVLICCHSSNTRYNIGVIKIIVFFLLHLILLFILFCFNLLPFFK